MAAPLLVLTLYVCAIGASYCEPETVTVRRPTFHDPRVCAAYEPLAAYDFVQINPGFRVIGFTCGPPDAGERQARNAMGRCSAHCE
jgi:hypothetical protein